MSKIRVESKCALYDGISITFKAPCNSDAVDGLNVYYDGAATAFSFRDASGADISGRSNLFSTGAYVKVVLDTTNKYAYLQNADTNTYLEASLDTKISKTHSVAYAGKFLKVSSDGTITYDFPIAKFTQGPILITSTQTLDLTLYGLSVGDQVNVVCIGGGGGGASGASGYTSYGKGGAGGKPGDAYGSNSATGCAGGGGAGGGYGAGGGGGAGIGMSSTSGGGGGGGGGGYLTAATITLTDTSVAVTIGAAGTGGKSSGTATRCVAGGAGGTTSFGSYLSATGGAGGAAGASSGQGPSTGGISASKGGDGGARASSNSGGGGGGGGGWIVEGFTAYQCSDGENGEDATSSADGKGGAGGSNGGIGGSGDAQNGNGYPASFGTGTGAVFIWY